MVSHRDCDGLIPLTSDEMASLLRVSGKQGAIQFAFGSGGVALIVATAPWAAVLLREWRGDTYCDGAGI